MRMDLLHEVGTRFSAAILPLQLDWRVESEAEVSTLYSCHVDREEGEVELQGQVRAGAGGHGVLTEERN